MRAKKHKSCCIIYMYMIYVRACTYVYVYISLSPMTTFSNNMAAETARNSSAFVIYIAIAGISESTRY